MKYAYILIFKSCSNINNFKWKYRETVYVNTHNTFIITKSDRICFSNRLYENKKEKLFKLLNEASKSPDICQNINAPLMITMHWY